MNRPFNEQKYKGLLEGLEVSEIKMSKLKEDNRIFRIDSSFFSKAAYNLDEFIKNKPHKYLKEKEVVSGPFGSTLKSHSYLSKGIPFIRIENIKGGFNIDTSEVIYISEENNKLLKNSQLFVDDVILSKVGNSIGYYARVDENVFTCNISENNIGIKLENYNSTFKHFILCYLNCYYGYALTIRRISGNAQPKLNVFDITEIPIPTFSNDFYEIISKVIIESKTKIDNSKSLYSQAEQLLLSELGLENWQPTTENINQKSFKDSFLATGRLDAEYYQPKYEEILSCMNKFETKELGKIVSISKSIEPGSEAYQDSGIPFVRVSNISKTGLSDTDIYLDRAKYENDNLKPKKDTILLTKDGSVGIAYKADKDLDVITSGALLHLKIVDKDFLPDYLTLILNSIIVKLQSERDSGGSIIQHWKPSEIEQVIIPKISFEIQQQIAELIQESFALKQESEHLLEVAKRAVEVAIEEDEGVAMEKLRMKN